MPGEDRWFQPTVRNRLSQAVVLANFTIKLGKFYDIKNPYEETASAQGTIIQGKSENEWGHCGRHLSPTGTEGSFEVHLEDSGEKIAEVFWDCPYIGNNQLVKNYVKPGYDVSFDGFSIPKGALGKGSINVRED